MWAWGPLLSTAHYSLVHLNWAFSICFCLEREEKPFSCLLWSGVSDTLWTETPRIASHDLCDQGHGQCQRSPAGKRKVSLGFSCSPNAEQGEKSHLTKPWAKRSNSSPHVCIHRPVNIAGFLIMTIRRLADSSTSIFFLINLFFFLETLLSWRYRPRVPLKLIHFNLC